MHQPPLPLFFHFSPVRPVLPFWLSFFAFLAFLSLSAPSDLGEESAVSPPCVRLTQQLRLIAAQLLRTFNAHFGAQLNSSALCRASGTSAFESSIPTLLWGLYSLPSLATALPEGLDLTTDERKARHTPLYPSFACGPVTTSPTCRDVPLLVR
jgi:hypothetical protein